MATKKNRPAAKRAPKRANLALLSRMAAEVSSTRLESWEQENIRLAVSEIRHLRRK